MNAIKNIVIIVSSIVFLVACGPKPPQTNPVSTGSISGTITITGSIQVDSDTNNPSASFISNNLAGSAQQIPNITSINGYLTKLATGISDDTFEFDADEVDIFRGIFQNGQSIQLDISDFNVNDPAAVDIDIFLYDVNDTGTVVLSSEGTSSTEVINITADGEYYIFVLINSGSSNYNLDVAAGSAIVSAKDHLSMGFDFVTNQIISKTTQLNTSTSKTHYSVQKYQVKSAIGQNIDLLKFDSNSELAAIKQSIDNPFDGKYGFTLSESQLLKYITIKNIKHLRSQSNTVYAEPDYILKPFYIPNDSDYGEQWNYPIINLPTAWDTTLGDSNVIVAVVDTGVFLTHPDLNSNLILTGGYDFITDITAANDTDGRDNDPDDAGDANPISGASWHGTHVSGTIAAVSNNTTGVSGVAPGIKILPIRALGIGGGPISDVMQAIRYSAGLSNDTGSLPPQAADIINLSLGGGGFSQSSQDTFTEVRNAGVIVIAAAGNDGVSALAYPASYSGVVSVSAIKTNKTKASYSNYGTMIDVAAPGGESIIGDGSDIIKSTWVDSSLNTRVAYYYWMQGTSMAAPHVAGVVALMKSVYPGLTPAELDALISSGAITEDLGSDGAAVRNDNYGYGMIDANLAVQEAVNLAAAAPVAAPTLTPSATTLNNNSQSTQLTIALGDDVLTVINFSTDQIWATVVPDSIDAGGIGSYLLNIDRSSLTDGIYTINVSFTMSDTSTLAMVASVLVSSTSYTSDAGYHYILLVNAVTGATVMETFSNSSNNFYSYEFTNVPYGSYEIVAGTDHDNDLIICDNGESCGSYLDPAQPTIINLNGNLTSINFNTSNNHNGIGITAINPVSRKISHIWTRTE